MEDHSFDQLTKKLASPLSRRGILKAAAASVTGAILVKVDGGHALAADKTCSAAGDKCNPGHDCCAGLVCNPTGPGANGTCGCPSGMVSSGGQCVCSSTGQPPCGSSCCLKCQACDSTGHCVDICPLTQPCSTCNATTASPAGTCVSKCPANQSCCCGMCSDTSGNPSNCGTCGNVCPTPPNTTGPACTGGNCGYQACKPGFLDCDGNPANGCEVNPANDSNNCGGCGTVCPSGQHCSSGACTCTGTPCSTDMSCCMGYFCQGGVCNLQGTTGQSCSANDQCSSGNCSGGTCCPSGFTNCGGTCTNTQSDTGNCGGCGNVCNPPNANGPTCTGGICGFQSCKPGFADCDGNPANGCETNLATSVNNCGACGNVCHPNNATGPTCSSGMCGYVSCNPGFADCNGNRADGCETNVATSVNNCGACGNVCPNAPNTTGSTCSGGACGIQACQPGFLDCDHNPINGCEVDSRNDPNNCGGCGVRCPSGATCQNSHCCNPTGTLCGSNGGLPCCSNVCGFINCT